MVILVQTSLRIEAHKDDVNAVCFGEDSPNIIVTGSDDHLIKVRCNAATTVYTLVGAFCSASAVLGHWTEALEACSDAALPQPLAQQWVLLCPAAAADARSVASVPDATAATVTCTAADVAAAGLVLPA